MLSRREWSERLVSVRRGYDGTMRGLMISGKTGPEYSTVNGTMRVRLCD